MKDGKRLRRDDMDRRRFLELCGKAFAAVTARTVLPPWVWRSARKVDGSVREGLRQESGELETQLEEIIGDNQVGVVMRRVSAEGRVEDMASVNGEQLLPMGSLFKAFACVYYLYTTPRGEWQVDEGMPVYQMVVRSDYVQTAEVLAEVSDRVGGDDNAIEAFNNFLQGAMGMEQGIYGWGFTDEDRPTFGIRDERFAPGNGRVVDVDGTQTNISNVTTTEDVCNGWQRLAEWYARGQRGDLETEEQRRIYEAVVEARRLLMIPNTVLGPTALEVSVNGQILEGDHWSKEGFIPDSLMAGNLGRVRNDAGIWEVGGQYWVVSMMSVVVDGVISNDQMDGVLEEVRRVLYAEMAGGESGPGG